MIARSFVVQLCEVTWADKLTRRDLRIVDYRNSTPECSRRALLPCDKQEEGGIDVSTSRIRT